MPHKKHQNAPPSKGQFHGVIENLRFYRLRAKGKYEAVQHSVAFAFLKPADLTRFMKRRAEIGENGVVREFIEWAQKARRRKTPERGKTV
jgi:hypothetical protein